VRVCVCVCVCVCVSARVRAWACLSLEWSYWTRFCTVSDMNIFIVQVHSHFWGAVTVCQCLCVCVCARAHTHTRSRQLRDTAIYTIGMYTKTVS